MKAIKKLKELIEKHNDNNEKRWGSNYGSVGSDLKYNETNNSLTLTIYNNEPYHFNLDKAIIIYRDTNIKLSDINECLTNKEWLWLPDLLTNIHNYNKAKKLIDDMIGMEVE